VVVAATGRSGQLASYSQRGAGVDVAAPGGDPKTKDTCTQADCVTSLYPGNRYAVAAGTSMAAPHVSGVAALLLGQDPARTRDQVIARLKDTARPLAQAGSGLIDAAAALGVPPTTTSPRATAAPKPVPVVRPTRGPLAQPAVSATPVPVRTAQAPSLSPPTPTASALAPVVAGTPSPSAAEPKALRPDEDDVPLPVSLLAGGLVTVAGASVAAFWRPRQL
jgi:subtilisin family serine protease